MVTVISDRHLFYDLRDYKIILIGIGSNCSMGRGFSFAIKRHFPNVALTEKTTGYCDLRKYGEVHPIESDGIKFCLCYINNNVPSHWEGGLYLRYEALESCLRKINSEFKGQRIGSPIMGSTRFDGGGDKDRIISMFEKICTDVDVFLYDEGEWDYRTDVWRRICAVYGARPPKKIRDKWLNLLHWQYNNGFYTPMPPDFRYKKRLSDYDKSMRVSLPAGRNKGKKKEKKKHVKVKNRTKRRPS